MIVNLTERMVLKVLRKMYGSKFQIGGRFQIHCYDKDFNLKWLEDIHNITTDQGLNHILDVYFHGTTPVSPWYVGLKGTNQVPASNWNAAGIGTKFTEATIYSQETRVEYNEAAASSKSTTNSANPAEFSINNSGTIYGAFLASVATKSSTLGFLYCISDFGTPRPVVNADTLRIVYTVSAADA